MTKSREQYFIERVQKSRTVSVSFKRDDPNGVFEYIFLNGKYYKITEELSDGSMFFIYTDVEEESGQRDPISKLYALSFVLKKEVEVMSTGLYDDRPKRHFSSGLVFNYHNRKDGSMDGTHLETALRTFLDDPTHRRQVVREGGRIITGVTLDDMLGK